MHRIYTALTLALFTTTTVIAQEPAPVHELPKTIITATRTDRSIDTIPANVTVITAADIAGTTAQTIPDALRHLAGITVYDFGNNRRTTVDLRGFGEVAGTNTLVMVDGRRINSADLSDVDWTNIPLDRIDRIEIVRGGGSVLYGDKAVAGVINIRTKHGGQDTRVYSESVVGYYTTWKQSLGVSGSIHDLAYALDGSYYHSDGYRTNSEFMNRSAGLRLSYSADDWLALDLTIGVKDDRYGLPGEIAEDVDRRETDDPNSWSESKDRYIHLAPTFVISEATTLRLDLTWRQYQSRSFLDFGGFTTVDEFSVYEATAGARMIHDYTFFDHESELVIGYAYDTGDKHYQNDFFANGDLNRHESGVFINNMLAVLPGKLYLDLGYRRATTKYNYDNFDDEAFDSDAAHIGMTWRYAKGSKMFVAYDRAYRTLRLEEIFGNTSPLPPQISKHYQAGIRHRINEWLSGAITGFRIDTRDEIFYNPVADGFGNNASYDETERWGAEFELWATPTDELTLFANYAWIDPRLEAGDFDDNEIPGVPNVSGSLGGTWSPAEKVTIDLRGRWAKNRRALSDWDGAAESWDDSYFVVDTKATWQLGMVELFIGVNNVLDQEYSDIGVWQTDFSNFPAVVDKIFTYPAPERNVIGGVRIKKTF
jgi:iron complex outermembrane receptor protein